MLLILLTMLNSANLIAIKKKLCLIDGVCYYYIKWNLNN